MMFRRDIPTKMMAAALGITTLVSSPLSAASSAGEIMLRQCSAVDGLGERILCNVMNASMVSSHTAWERVSEALPALLGIIFAYQTVMIFWNYDPSSLIERLAKLIARTILGWFIITAGGSYGQFYSLYAKVESFALSVVSSDAGRTFGSRPEGNPQMGTLTGVILSIPDSLYGGMVSKRQTEGESQESFIGCVDYTSPDGMKVLESIFKDNYAIGTNGMICLGKAISKSAFEESPAAAEFIKNLSTLVQRSDTSGGPSASYYGNRTQAQLVEILNATKSSVSVAERRKIEDTLFLWSDVDEMINIACAEKDCGQVTSSANKSPWDYAKSAASAVQSVASGQALFDLVFSSVKDWVSLNMKMMSLYLMGGLNAWPYWSLWMATVVVWVGLTWQYFRLAVVPAIAIPFVLVFYTAWWVATPIEGQITRMITTYRDKIIKYALGPAVVVFLGGLAMSLLQGVVNTFVQGMN
jgi:hypothetical protein